MVPDMLLYQANVKHLNVKTITAELANNKKTGTVN